MPLRAGKKCERHSKHCLTSWHPHREIPPPTALALERGSEAKEKPNRCYRFAQFILSTIPDTMRDVLRILVRPYNRFQTWKGINRHEECRTWANRFCCDGWTSGTSCHNAMTAEANHKRPLVSGLRQCSAPAVESAADRPKEGCSSNVCQVCSARCQETITPQSFTLLPASTGFAQASGWRSVPLIPSQRLHHLLYPCASA